MARISDVSLSIDAEVLGNDPQATLTVNYTAEFDLYDRTSNQLYEEGWRVFGADGGAGEDQVDDTIQTTPAGQALRFQADGQSRVDREIVIQLDTAELDEDVQNPDEIKASVSLTPVGPFDDSQLSNRVVLSV